MPIDSSALAERLSEVNRVLVTKGKKILDLDPSSDKQEILDTAIGRSGNLRAPSIRHGKLMIVGFSEDAYQELL